MPELNIRPYPKQVEFFKATTRHVAYGGARGGGKSWSARTKAILLALTYNGIQIIILRRTLKELRENHVLPLMSQLDGIAKYNAEAKEFTFPNKSRIVLGYCAAESDVLQYQGQAYDAIMLEEATQFTEFQKDTLTESNRSSGMMNERFTPRMYYTANPGGVGHSWFKRLFVDRDYRQAEKEQHYTFIKSTVYDNEFLMTNNPEYVENLENLPEMRMRAMLLGDWDAFEGQYFGEFNKDIHVCDPFVIPIHWRRYFTMDYGLDMLAGYWIAVDDRGKSYVYKEVYKSNLIISDAAKEILRINNGEPIYKWYAPPDLWNRRQETGKSAVELFFDNGIRLEQANNNRVDGWLNVKEWLKSYTDEQGIETASIVFFSNCTNIIRCIPQLQSDDRDPNDVAREPHELTHGPDAIRYYIAGRPVPYKPINKKPIDNINRFVTKKTTGGHVQW